MAAGRAAHAARLNGLLKNTNAVIAKAVIAKAVIARSVATWQSRKTVIAINRLQKTDKNSGLLPATLRSRSQ